MVKKIVETEKTFCDNCDKDISDIIPTSIYKCKECQKEKELCYSCRKTCKECNENFCIEHMELNTSYCKICWPKIEKKEKRDAERLLLTNKKKQESISIEFTGLNANIFKNAIEIIASIIDESEFELSKEEFKIVNLDASRICLVILRIKKGFFKEFSIIGDKTLTDLNIEDLVKAFENIDKDRFLLIDSIKILKEPDEATIKFIVKGDNERIISLPILDLEFDYVPHDNLDKINFESSITLDADNLKKIINEFKKCDTELITFTTNKKGWKIKSESKAYNIEMFLNKSKYNKEVKSTYNLVFLNSIVSKINPNLFSKIKFEIKTDHPIRITLGGDLIDLTLYLAPRVEEVDVVL